MGRGDLHASSHGTWETCLAGGGGTARRGSGLMGDDSSLFKLTLDGEKKEKDGCQKAFAVSCCE